MNQSISICLNGKTLDTTCADLGALLAALELSVGSVAIAVNDEVIPSADYAHKSLCAGDRIEIIQAVSGG